MDKLLLKKAAVQSLVLMIAVITLSYAMNRYQLTVAEAKSQNGGDYGSGSNSSKDAAADLVSPSPTAYVQETDSETPLTGVEALKSKIAPEILNKLGENFLVVKKPKGDNLSIDYEDIYINKSILLKLTGMTDNSITSDMIIRVRGNEMFYGDPDYTETTSTEVDEDGTSQEVVTKDYGSDLSHGLSISIQEDSSERLYSAQILLTLDSVYAYSILEDAGYYYISLKKPSEVYDRVIVIDAGHGGKDAGAISRGNTYYEKNINLDILLKLKELLDQENIKVYYTRTADETVYLRPREELANAVDADYFISIHCNANTVSSPNGSEALYYDNEFKGVKAKDLATLFSEELGKAIPLKQKGIVKRNYEDIYIMDKSIVPTVLLEIGYLTNNKDMDYLSKEENRRAVAQGIFNGIMRAYDELPVKK